jgi:hypothetical protein
MLALEDVRAGDVLARPLWSPEGQVVMREGTRLEPGHLEILRRRGVRALAVEMPGFEGIEPAPGVDPPLWQRLAAFLTSLPRPFNQEAARTARALAEAVVETVADRIRTRPVELLTPTDAASVPATVAVNRALVAAAAGMGPMAPDRLVDAVLACLLADSGEENALATGTVRDPDSPAQIERMAAAAVAYLEAVPWLSAYTMATLHQLGARWDGSGAPSLKGEEIWAGAQLAAPADKLARLVVDTPEHPAAAAHEALEWLYGGAGSDYAHTWVGRIAQRVAPYGVGTVVRLSTGQVGVVAELTPSLPARPRLRILVGEGAGGVLDLGVRAAHHIAIAAVVSGRTVA